MQRSHSPLFPARIMGDCDGRYFHLNILASAYRGGGYARAVAQPMLDLADENALCCYLEDTTNSPAVYRFYESLGFLPVAETQLGPVNVIFRRREPQRTKRVNP